MKSLCTISLFMMLASTESLAFGKHSVPKQETSAETSRRKMIVSSVVAFTGGLLSVSPSEAKYVLNEETGDFENVEVEEEGWQTTWKQRLDKAQSMSSDEIFNAARGAGNLDLKEGEETPSGRKRRAMSACRDKDYRAKASVSEKECNSRVMGGETDFILN